MPKFLNPLGNDTKLEVKVHRIMGSIRRSKTKRRTRWVLGSTVLLRATALILGLEILTKSTQI